MMKEQITDALWYQEKAFTDQGRYFESSRGPLHYLDTHHKNLATSHSPGKFATLFIHGTPGWGYEWRHFLGKDLGRIIIPDHIGFGLSHRPKEFVSLEEHVSHLEALLQSLGITAIHLVVHDFGGPIGIKLSLKNPGLVQKNVILNSWYWPFQDAVPSFRLQKMFFKSWLLRFLYRHLGFSAAELMKAAWGKAIPLSKEEHASFKDMQPKHQREGTVSFLKSLTESDSFYGDYAKDLRSLQEIPSLLIWGKSDGLLVKQHLAKWQELLPDLPAIVLTRAGHWPHLEEKDVVTETISEFLLGP
ncbi:MAG: alpha/beta hydrolase [Pseudomonadota bacterium]